LNRASRAGEGVLELVRAHRTLLVWQKPRCVSASAVGLGLGVFQVPGVRGCGLQGGRGRPPLIRSRHPPHARSQAFRQSSAYPDQKPAVPRASTM